MSTSEIPKPDNNIAKDIVKTPELDIKDGITLVEMYAYKYTQNILTESFSSYTEQSYTKDNGDICKITVPINEDDPNIPLQMVFNANTEKYVRYCLYSNKKAYESKDTINNRFQPIDSVDDWIEQLNLFFGPLKFNIQGIHARNQFSDTSFLHSSNNSSETRYNVQLKIYPGYKHEIYEEILRNKVRPGINKQPISQDNLYDLKQVEKLKIFFGNINIPVSDDVLRNIASVIVKARSNKISDKLIFHILAKQYHPDCCDEKDIMKLINEIYNKKEGKFKM